MSQDGYCTSECDVVHCWLCDVRRQGSTTQSEDLAGSGAQQLCEAKLAANQQYYGVQAPSWQSGRLSAEPASHAYGSQPEHPIAPASAQMIQGQASCRITPAHGMFACCELLLIE